MSMKENQSAYVAMDYDVILYVVAIRIAGRTNY